MNEIEDNLDIYIKNMLEDILTMPELRKLALDKGITVKGLKKTELAEKVREKFLLPENLIKSYKELTENYQFLIQYLKSYPVILPIRDGANFLIEGDNYKKLSRIFYSVDRGLLKIFKEELAVKGLIVITESNRYSYYDSKYERFSIYLPREIAKLLPGLLIEGKKIKDKGTENSFENFAKNIFLSSLKLEKPEGKLSLKILKYIDTEKNVIKFDNIEIHSGEEFLDYILFSWYGESKLGDFETGIYLFNIIRSLTAEEWLNKKDILKYFWRLTRYRRMEEIEAVLTGLLDELFIMGVLKKSYKNAEIYYRISEENLKSFKSAGERLMKPDGINIKKDGSIKINSKDTSLLVLIEIILISKWSYKDKNFICKPSLLKLGKYYKKHSDFSNLLYYNYLTENSHLYNKAFKYVAENYGKFMLHENLSLFEIKDLTISALLSYNFPDFFHTIGGNFFAAPREREEEILTFLNKKKYSIKIK